MFNKKREIIFVGKILFESGLVDTHSGNISIRLPQSILITGTGSMLGYLDFKDIVEVPIWKEAHRQASSEYPIHRTIYLNTRYNAVIHAHSFFTVLISYFEDVVVPQDSEGKFYFKKVPVLDCGDVTVGSKCVKEEIVRFLNESNVIIIKKHGVFAAANTLFEALKFVSALENSCKILYYLRK